MGFRKLVMATRSHVLGYRAGRYHPAPGERRRGRSGDVAGRELAAGTVPGLESYRIDKVIYNRDAKATDYAINDRVLEAFRNYIRKDASRHLTVAPQQRNLLSSLEDNMRESVVVLS